MSFADIADMATNSDLRERIAACAATQVIAPDSPVQWAMTRQWAIAASPGWSEAWNYAVTVGLNLEPGKDPAVITDAMILAAVQAIG